MKPKKQSISKSISKVLHYTDYDDEYHGVISLNEEEITLHIKSMMEPFNWIREFTLKELIDSNRKWTSVINTEGLFMFIKSCFKKSNVKLIRTDDKGLKLEFKVPFGDSLHTLGIQLRSAKINLNETLIDQSNMIKILTESKDNMIETIRMLKEDYNKLNTSKIKAVSLIAKANSGIQTSSSNFTDMQGTESIPLEVKGKSSIEWSLHINGLYFNNCGGYNASFRLKILDEKNNKIYWPSEKGCFMAVNSNGAITLPFHFKDHSELNKGKYTMKIEWAYSSNSTSYLMYYYSNYGDIRVIAEIMNIS